MKMLMLIVLSSAAVKGITWLIRENQLGTTLLWIVISLVLFSLVRFGAGRLAQARDDTYSECPKCGIRYQGKVTICSNCGASCRVYEDYNK